ncbi:MAG: winged helix-turn-helix transcriptional regulator [Candidatus Marinimicrobia bacterium]|nr:winged helix-turn-helix transcriptional regulator [Candidatus Neomarinimicrobiota bacterium]
MISYEKCTDILKAIAHPSRLEILCRLDKQDGCNVSRIQENLGLPQSTISQHLKILKNAGVLNSERKGTIVCYKLKDMEIMKIIEVLRNLE